jgi:hypothetical protein
MHSTCQKSKKPQAMRSGLGALALSPRICLPVTVPDSISIQQLQIIHDDLKVKNIVLNQPLRRQIYRKASVS